VRLLCGIDAHLVRVSGELRRCPAGRWFVLIMVVVVIIFLSRP
jgi:hypothetical protein